MQEGKIKMWWVFYYFTAFTRYLIQRICVCFHVRAFRNNMFFMPPLISAGYCCASFLKSTTVVLLFKSEIMACLHFVVGHWAVLPNCYRNFKKESMRLYFTQTKVWDWPNLWIKAEYNIKTQASEFCRFIENLLDLNSMLKQFID